jgi:putative endonuclease
MGLLATEVLPMKAPWFLYLLECKNGAYYAGITNNLESRFSAHLSGKGARYTRANPPIKILATKLYVDRSAASTAEATLKKLPRIKKLGFFCEQEP